MLHKFIKNLETVSDERSKQEIAILREYLPEQMTETEIRDAIQVIITTNNYSTIKDMGKVMSDFNFKFNGQADMKIVSGLVKENLQK
jgi:hypothetical protein